MEMPGNVRTVLYVASDLHIGDGSDRDNYRKGTNLYYALERMLENLDKEFRNDDAVSALSYFVMLGDAVNGEYGHVNCYNSPAFYLIREFIDLHPNNVLYVVGNHDSEAKSFAPFLHIPTKHCAQRFWVNEQIMLMHGHILDPLCDGKSLIGMGGKFGSWFVANVTDAETEDRWRNEAPDIDPNDEKAATLYPRLSSISPADVYQSDSDRRLADRAAEYIRGFIHGQDECAPTLQIKKRYVNLKPTIMCGHTHQQKIRIDYGDCSYINAGKFSKDGVLTYTTDSEKLTIVRGE